VIVEGAVPEVAETDNQLPPFDVLVVRLQVNVPTPAFRIWSTCEGGLPPGSIEKLTWPGVLSKKVPDTGATTRVTGTVCVRAPEEKTTCPEYVPAAMATLVVTTTRTPLGVTQQLPEGEAVSQLPPDEVEVETENPKLVAVVLETATTCGNGSLPPKAFVKYSGAIGANC
jgi:hypothetical protein